MKSRPNPKDHPAAVSLTKFRDQLEVAQNSINSKVELFTDENLTEPGQTRVLSAIARDIAKIKQLSPAEEFNPSFNPQSIFRGVKSRDGSLTRKELFGVVAREVANSKADIPVQYRWWAWCSAIQHGNLPIVASAFPNQDLAADDLMSVSTYLTLCLVPGTDLEETTLNLLAIKKKYDIVKSYLDPRSDKERAYVEMAHDLAGTLALVPQLRQTKSYTDDLLPALEFIQSQLGSKEKLISNRTIDLLSTLFSGTVISNGHPLASTFTEETVDKLIKSVANEARLTDFLFSCVDPGNMKLSGKYLCKLDPLFSALPSLRQQMPTIGSVWARSRLTKQVKRKFTTAATSLRGGPRM